MKSFKSILEEKDFIFTFELVPARGVRTRQYKNILQFLDECVKKPLFDAFSITDNAGGHPTLSPIALGRELKKRGLLVIIHFSCSDKNRNQIESELLALDREGFYNLLVLTGDYPLHGYMGMAKPVFDLDSVNLLRMISEIEKGITSLPPIPFFKGCVTNPFKIRKSELLLQYFKLYKKLKAGAYFIVTQIGFSPAKWKEIKTILNIGLTKVFSELLEDESLYSPEDDRNFKKIPLIGSLMYITPSFLKILKRVEIPGILLGKKIAEKIENNYTENTTLEILAKFCAILKGFGYKGIHLCGFPLNYEKILEFMEKFNKYKDNWEKYVHEFDNKVVIERNGKIKETDLALLIKNNKIEGNIKLKKSLHFYLNNFLHLLFFELNSPFFLILKKIHFFINKNKYLKKCYTSLEYFIKKILYNCQECGECTLWEHNYFCTQGECAKYLLNGPCGGSIDGYCEIYPYTKKCVYVKAFEMAGNKKNLKKLLLPSKNYYIPPKNWKLYKTSSWINFYLSNEKKS